MFTMSEHQTKEEAFEAQIEAELSLHPEGEGGEGAVDALIILAATFDDLGGLMVDFRGYI
jgi:hypothetical protein